MFWDAVLSVSVHTGDSSSSSSMLSSSETTSSSSTSEHSLLSSSSSDAVAQIETSLYVTVYTMVITIPFMTFLGWMYTKTLEIPIPESDHEPAVGLEDGSDPGFCSPDASQEDSGLDLEDQLEGNSNVDSTSTQGGRVRSKSLSMAESEETKINESELDESKTPAGGQLVLENGQDHEDHMFSENHQSIHHLFTKVETVLEIHLAGMTKEDEDKIQRRTDALFHEYFEDNKHQRSGFRQAITEGKHYMDLRNKVRRAMELEIIVSHWIEVGDQAKADVAMLLAATRDTMTLFEARASEWFTNKHREIYISWPRDEEEEKSGFTKKQVKRRHFIGWAFTYAYCFAVAYYICIFGVTQGSAVTNSWLKTFFIGFIEDLLILLTFKLYLLIYAFPLAAPQHIQVERFSAMPSYATSVQVAHEFPALESSKLILDRSTINSSKIPSKFKVAFTHKDPPGSLRYYWNQLKRGIVKVLAGVILLAPLGLQELFIDVWSAIGLNFLILSLAYAYYTAIGYIGFYYLISCIIIAAFIFSICLTCFCLPKKVREKFCCMKKSRRF